MALPYIVNKLEDIDEAHRALYTERDGKFYLDVDGVPEPKTDAKLQKELTDAIRKQNELEKDLHKAREGKNSEAKAKADLEAQLDKQRTETKELLKKLGMLPDDGKDSDGDADLRKRIEAIEEQKRTERISAIESERDAARKEAALIRALAGKVEDVDYAIYRAQRIDAYAGVKVEDGKVVGIDELIAALGEAGVVPTGDDDKDKEEDKATPPASRSQSKLSDSKRPWRDARNWLDFLALPYAVQEQAQAKDSDWCKALERKHYSNL